MNKRTSTRRHPGEVIARAGLVTLLTVLSMMFLNQCSASSESDPETMTKTAAAQSIPKGSNRLIHEKSPYLLQHADNPVDWYPWGEEAFAKAAREDKPVFLSIGYSTCHWCHVMEHECFEDTQVARLMNEAFVSIKVDREERPDIDNIYMAVCQMMTGGGGWPLTILMTPDKKPFFAGTYFPKQSRAGRIGMIDLVPRVVDAWTNKRSELLASARQITAALNEPPQSTAGAFPGAKALQVAYEQLSGRFDPRYGGFGTAPKFPTPHNLLFLLRTWKRDANSRALMMVEKTLAEMRRGGMYDHIGYGFHRYSTDQQWLLPHFEKMLYDQALLAMAYTETFQATHKAEYETTAREILTYVLRDMTAPEGGFYSAEDADSDGEEGKFYVWSIDETRAILGPEDADLTAHVYNFTPEGNFVEQATRERPGTNIPHLTKSLTALASELQIPEADLRARLEGIRQKLFTVREKRIHPYKDDKVLTDWNGLMIAAFAKAARTFDEPEYTRAATRAADFILGTLRDDDGRLIHRFRDGEASLPAHADDYAFFVWGLIELYETTFDVTYLQAALNLNGVLLKRYWDTTDGGFFFTADDLKGLIARKKETYDGAIPSANSVAYLNLLRLGRITGNPELEEKAEGIGRAFSTILERAAGSHTLMATAIDFAVGPSFEIIIAGTHGADDTRAMMRALGSAYIPNQVTVFKPGNEQSPVITRLAAYTEGHETTDGRATAYVCQNYACKLPTTDPKEMMKLLGE